MKRGNLADQWTVIPAGGPVPDAVVAAGSVPAAVPGSVHTDLLAESLIPDPYLDASETELRWMHDADWRFSRPLALDPAADGERIDLVFDGIDTVATLTWGAQQLGRTANMHRSYRFDVRTIADGMERPLAVDIRSASAYARDRIAELGPRPSAYPDSPFNFVRKMACSFGWDWGPDLRTAGIWKPVRVERWRVARLAEIRPAVTVDPDGTGRVRVEVRIERSGLQDAGSVRIRAAVLGATAETVVDTETGILELTVPDAPLWWPVGYGEQPLAELTVELVDTRSDTADTDDGTVLDTWARRVGFRTIDLDLAEDEYGTRFLLRLNGREIAVRGANWIPDDHFVTRITADRINARLDQAVDAHLNLMRVWGGGIYESEDFYDACDERGLLVWQDFLLACAAYPEEEPIRSELEAEARENVVRLMPHASLVVWNGGNENIWGHEDWGWKAQLQGRSWGGWYARTLLPSVVAELDPTRPYTDNSPFSPRRDPLDVHPNDPDHGTHHQWEVWNRVDYTDYRSEIPRFCSEFGFQGPPAWRTLSDWVHAADGGPLTRVADPAQDPVFLVHQKAEDGNGKLDRGMAPHVGVPADFADWHWAGQLNQARAVRYAVDHYRSWWPRTAGWILWQLNDCWPVTSWAAIDSAGRQKPLWYALRRASAPRVLSVVERDGRPVVAVVNDTDGVWSATLRVRRETFAGDRSAEQASPVQVPPRSVAHVGIEAGVADFADVSSEVVIAELDDASTTWTGVEDIDLNLDPAPVTATATRTPDGYRVELTARSYARDVALLVDRAAPDAVADDMLITLPAGARAVVNVRTDAEIDPAVFTATPVLRTANDLRAVPARP